MQLKEMENMKNTEYFVEEFNLEEEHYPHIVQVTNDAFSGHHYEGVGALFFDIESINMFFGSPFLSKCIFVRAVHKETGEWIGFCAAIPRMLSVKTAHREYKTYLIGFYTIKQKYQKMGISRALGRLIIKIGIEKGLDGYIAFFEEGEHGIDAANSVSRKTKQPLDSFLNVDNLLLRVLNVSKFSRIVNLKFHEKMGLKLLESVKNRENASIRQYSESDFPQIKELLGDFPKNNIISLIRDPIDFKWFIENKRVTTVVHLNQQAKVDGFIAMFKFHITGFGNIEAIGCIDTIHTYNLNEDDARDLANFLCLTAKELGIVAIQTPKFPYFDVTPFKKSGFIEFPHGTNASFFNFTEIQIPNDVESCYLELR